MAGCMVGQSLPSDISCRGPLTLKRKDVTSVKCASRIPRSAAHPSHPRINRAQGGPGPGGAQKWPGRLRLGRQATLLHLTGVPRSVPAVPDAIGGLYDEIWRFSGFQNSISWT